MIASLAQGAHSDRMLKADLNKSEIRGPRAGRTVDEEGRKWRKQSHAEGNFRPKSQ